jgi:gliding motility-associated-like protein
MSKNEFNIEELFQKEFEDFSLQPSENHWSKINSKLRARDFFRFSLKTFNFYYMAFLLTSAISVFALLVPDNWFNFSNQKAEMPSKTIIEDKQSAESELPKKEVVEKEVKILVDETPANDNENVVATSAQAKFAPSAFEGCAPLTVNFTNLSVNATDYSWDFDDGNISKDNSPVHSFKKAGKYTVTLSATAAEEEKTLNYKQKIVVHPNPKAVFIVDEGRSDFDGKTIAFSNKSQDADNYTWHFGDAATENTQNPVHTYNELKDYQVTLIAQNKHNCVDTATVLSKFLADQCQISFPSKITFYTNRNQNARFKPVFNGVKNYHLKIFDRYDKVIFETYDINKSWNGRVRGVYVPAGKYNWEAKGTFSNKKNYQLNGILSVDIKGKQEYEQY